MWGCGGVRASSRGGGLAFVDDGNLDPKEDGLFGEERERYEGTREVEVVYMRRDAVAFRIEVDDARVGPRILCEDAAAHLYA